MEPLKKNQFLACYDALKQKVVANCVWMLVLKIEGIERIYWNYLSAFQYV